MVQVDRSGKTWKAEVKDQYKADKGLSSEQQTPILLGDKILTTLPKDGGAMRERLALYNAADLHRPIWTSASDERFGLGPYVVVDKRLYILRENGDLYVYEVGDKSMTLRHKQAIIEDGVDAWGPMAFADGYLVMRDAKHVVCVKVME